MKLSARVEYGVRAMAVLAVCYPGGPLPLSEVARQENISLQFLEQIFPDLRKANLVKSRRGSKGGYMLASSPEKITVGDIVRAVKGPIAPVNCLAEDGKDLCHHDKSRCLTRQIWKRLSNRINDFLDEVFLIELIEAKELQLQETSKDV